MGKRIPRRLRRGRGAVSRVKILRKIFESLLTYSRNCDIISYQKKRRAGRHKEPRKV
nr:MAG TPA: hypothetical protein [Caudoviricetes sp.]